MKISVVIPFYNSQNTIYRSIDSVVNELKSIECEWEIFAIDDGSTDNSNNIINKYISENSLTKLIKIIHQENSGAGAARNIGLINASGDFIAFNDSDDEWLPGKLKVQFEVFSSDNDIMMVGCLHDRKNLKFHYRRVQYLNIISLKEMLFKFYFTTPGVIFKKEILTKAGLFNSSQRNAEEGLFFYRMTYYGKCILVNDVYTKNIVGKRSWGDSGLSGQIHKQSLGEFKNIRVIYKQGLINLCLFLLAFSFSFFKYTIRIIKSNIRK